MHLHGFNDREDAMWLNVGALAAGYAVMAVLVIVPMFAWVALRVPGGVAAMPKRVAPRRRPIILCASPALDRPVRHATRVPNWRARQ